MSVFAISSLQARGFVWFTIITTLISETCVVFLSVHPQHLDSVSWSISHILLSFVLQFNLGSAKCNCVGSHGFFLLANILFILFWNPLEDALLQFLFAVHTWMDESSVCSEFVVYGECKVIVRNNKKPVQRLALMSWAILFLNTVIVECLLFLSLLRFPSLNATT